MVSNVRTGQELTGAEARKWMWRAGSKEQLKEASRNWNWMWPPLSTCQRSPTGNRTGKCSLFCVVQKTPPHPSVITCPHIDTHHALLDPSLITLCDHSSLSLPPFRTLFSLHPQPTSHLTPLADDLCFKVISWGDYGSAH